MNHEIHVVDVHTACCHIGGDQHFHPALTKRRQVAVTGGLGQIAVQIDGGNARLAERARQLLGVMLGAGEKDTAPSTRGQSVNELLLAVRVRGFENVVGHFGHGGVGLVHSV